MAQSSKRLNLARKYRPSRLADLSGQSNVVRIVEEALKSDRIAPAYLLSGPRGVGKTSTARILARAASCLSEKFEARPCGKCKACKASETGQLMDIVEIDGASHTGVDDVRSIIEAISYRPSTGKRNVYIIDEVHMLSNAAFNALLKTLEEPPAHALFIFATTELEKLPSTVLSRVQRLELRRLHERDIFQSLKAIVKKEKITQTLLEQMLLLSGSEQVSQSVVDSFLGTIGTEQEIEILELIAESKQTEVLSKVHDFYEKGKDLIKLLDRLVVWTRVMLITKACGPDFLESEIPPEYAQRLLKAYQAWSQDDLDRLFEVLWRSHERMKGSNLPKITLETGLLRACRLTKTEDIARLMEKIEAGSIERPHAPSFTPEKQAPKPSFEYKPAAQKQKRAPAAKPTEFKTEEPTKTKKFKDASELVNAILKARPSLYALVKCAERSEIKKGVFRLVFPSGHFAFKQLSEILMQKELEKTINKLSSESLSLSIEENAKSSGPKKPEKRTDFIKEAKKQILDDPEIQKAAELLGGKVSSVTVEGIKT
jgi:DNA polymerase-3 subunit gamma/tau